MLDTPLVRLQCYEGIDAAEALYEWNYPAPAARASGSPRRRGEKLGEDDLFSADYLIRRPLLRALEHPGPRPAVLLIDEIDRADDDFEAFLLELLGEAAVTIPELGTIRATHPPVIVLTSNRTRDLHDAVKRRCLYHWIDYPSPQREVEIVRRRVKGAPETLAVQVANAVSRMRDSDVQKPPGIAEAIDWLAALSVLGIEALDAAAIDRTLGSVLKYDEDQEVDPRGRPRAARAAAMTDFGVETIELDLPPLAAGLARRLHEAGAADDARPRGRLRARARRSCGRCRGGGCTGRRARCSSPTRRRPRRSTACSPRCSGEQPAEGERAGGRVGRRRRRARSTSPPATAARARATSSTCRSRSPATRSGWRSKRFDELEPGELAQLYRLMAQLELATPLRRTRRHERGAPRARRRPAAQPARASLRTGGEPLALARRQRRIRPRRLVMLCDISGSMEPYARAYLQFLVSAAGSGPRVEAFVFATRLTRVTRALAGRNPERALRRAAEAAPDWSSGTRIGEALKRSSTTATAGAGWRAARSW